MSVRTIPINLESLIDLSVKLIEKNDITEILNTSLLTLMGKLTISSGCVFIPNNKSRFDLVVSKGRIKYEKQVDFKLSSFRTLEKDNLDDYNELFDIGLRYLIPVEYHGELKAVIGLGKRIVDDRIGDAEIQYSYLVASITANSLEVSKEKGELLRTKNTLEFRNLTLKTLFEITNDFSSFLSYEQILKLLSYHLMGQLMISKFALLRVKNSDKLEVILNKCESNFDERVLSELLNVKKLITRDNKSVPVIQELFEGSELEVISPMIVQGEIKGFLLVGRRMSGESFNHENISFIESLGNIAISALENERLFREELEMKKLESELEVALEIQQGFLPKEFPYFENLDIFGISVPSRHVAGDYFDFIVMPNNRIIIVIADVSGKGVAASLIMANVQAALRVVAELEIPLINIVEKLNKIVYDNTSPDKFVTFFIGILDMNKDSMSYINAGHNPPLIFNQNQEIVQLDVGGLPLGIFCNEYEYEIGFYKLRKNDLMVYYTDGITEAQNIRRKEYGEKRLISVIEKSLNKSSEDLVKEVIEDVKDFSQGFYQYDDITLSAVKFK